MIRYSAFAVLSLLLVAATQSQATVILEIIPAYGPNPVIDYSSLYDFGAIQAIQNRKIQAGDRTMSASAYQQVIGTAEAVDLISSATSTDPGFISYRGKDEAYLNQHPGADLYIQKGNGIYYGLRITDTDPVNPSLTLNSVIAGTLTLTESNNAGNNFESTDSKVFGGVTSYGDTIAGILPNGSAATDASQVVKEIDYVGNFSADDASGYGGPGLTDQQRLDLVRDYLNGYAPFTVTATYSLDGALPSTTTFGVTSSVPEPASLGLLALGSSLLLLRRRR